jgi:peroxiredoxin Q/BCP
MKAKALSLPDQNGRTRSLDEFAGSYVVLYFYPKDFTSGCTKEACDFRDALGELRTLGAMVVGVSKDTVTSHAKFDAKFELGFALLSDSDLSVTRSYGAFGTKNMYGKTVEGVKRSTVLIGPDGTVIKEWIGVKVAGHVAAVIGEMQRHKSGGGQSAGELPRAAKRAKATPTRGPGK